MIGLFLGVNIVHRAGPESSPGIIPPLCSHPTQDCLGELPHSQKLVCWKGRWGARAGTRPCMHGSLPERAIRALACAHLQLWAHLSEHNPDIGTRAWLAQGSGQESGSTPELGAGRGLALSGGPRGGRCAPPPSWLRWDGARRSLVQHPPLGPGEQGAFGQNLLVLPRFHHLSWPALALAQVPLAQALASSGQAAALGQGHARHNRPGAALGARQTWTARCCCSHGLESRPVAQTWLPSTDREAPRAPLPMAQQPCSLPRSTCIYSHSACQRRGAQTGHAGVLRAAGCSTRAGSWHSQTSQVPWCSPRASGTHQERGKTQLPPPTLRHSPSPPRRPRDTN